MWRLAEDAVETCNELFLVALGAGGWGLWALERAGLRSVALTHFDNTEGKDEHIGWSRRRNLKPEPGRLTERRQQRVQMR